MGLRCRRIVMRPLAPDCNCPKPGGAHDEKCAHIRHVRFGKYEPDWEIPEFLVRKREVLSEGVFD